MATTFTLDPAPVPAEPHDTPPPDRDSPLPESGCYSARRVGRQDRYEDWTMQLWEIARDHA